MVCSLASKFLFLWLGIISAFATPNSIEIIGHKGTITRQQLDASKNVDMLDIGSSTIEGIEEGALCALPQLNTLFIRFNEKFPKITRTFFECIPGLTVLKIWGNTDLKMEPDSLTELRHLEVLYVTHVDWLKLTKNTFASDKLLQVEFNSNKLTEIDADTFSLLSNLEMLKLIGHIQTLKPETFKNLNKLTHLHIEGSPLEEIPWEALGRLPELQVLHLEGTKIKDVDVEKLIQNFPKLSQLDIIKFPKDKEDRVKSELKKHNVHFKTNHKCRLWFSRFFKN